VRLIVARCEVTYTGRLTAHLPESTRLLMIKAGRDVHGLVRQRGVKGKAAELNQDALDQGASKSLGGGKTSGPSAQLSKPYATSSIPESQPSSTQRIRSNAFVGWFRSFDCASTAG